MHIDDVFGSSGHGLCNAGDPSKKHTSAGTYNICLVHKQYCSDGTKNRIFNEVIRQGRPGSLHMNSQIEHRTGQEGGTSVIPAGDGLFLACHFHRIPLTMSHGVFGSRFWV